ncbi:hypothetical protein E2C01_096972 [Portunus trituberculatus]|uniref:Uncharacterized protein n=2 Tax=Portunus trituberculatus TaxID=210409 RepID=A0A5B7K9W7_PORTR|nr:hypothetical protein [Portunus trituberculatus]
MKEELTIVEKMGKDDTNTNTITAEDINAYNWNDVNELLQIFHLRAPQKTQADEGDTAADAERGANLTEKDATTIATSPVKIKKRGRDVNMPVVIALVFLLVISLISLINLCCCCFHCTRCERKEVKDEKPVLLL